MTESAPPTRPPKGPLLALDVGTVRIGVAVCDGLWVTTRGLPTMDGRDRQRAFRQLEDHLIRTGALGIVVGIPVTMSGGDSRQTLLVRAFLEELRVYLAGRDLFIDTWDERLTTIEAEALLLEADLSRRKRKEKIDGMAAAVLLQSYLDAHRDGGREIEHSREDEP